MKHYKAPWGKMLIVSSSVATVLCLGIAAFMFKQGEMWSCWAGAVMLALIVGCALFTVRGYSVTSDAILVHRLFWNTRLPRSGLQSVQFEPSAMCKSIRTCGNGGFFSFSGFYWNKRLGSYRALVTDLRRTVVLRYSKRTVVVSPDAPEDFVRELSAANASGGR